MTISEKDYTKYLRKKYQIPLMDTTYDPTDIIRFPDHQTLTWYQKNYFGKKI